jgi:hypothetical protein
MPKAAHPDSNLTAGLDEALERSAKIPLTNLKCPVWVIRDRSIRQPLPPHVRFAPKADKQVDIALSPLCAISRQSALHHFVTPDAQSRTLLIETILRFSLPRR